MRSTTCISIFIAVCSVLGSTVQAELPPLSQDLLTKLEAYKQQQTDEFEATIGSKRQAVAEALKAQTIAETKNGNIDVAEAINHCKKELETNEKSPATLLEESKDIPVPSRELLKKLVEFEADEKLKLDQLLLSKTQDAIAILGSHLKTVSQQGNLDGAVAIRESIKELQSGAEEPSQDDSPSAPAITQAPKSPQIPEDAVLIDGSHYKIFEATAPMNWETARSKCLEKGGDLGWMPGIDGSTRLRSLLRPFVDKHGHCAIWIGGHRNAGEWQWLDGTKINEAIWEEGEDSRFKPDNVYMIRWIGSYRAAPAASVRSKGYLCRWD